MSRQVEFTNEPSFKHFLNQLSKALIPTISGCACFLLIGFTDHILTNLSLAFLLLAQVTL